MLRVWAAHTRSMSEMCGKVRRSQSELKASSCCFHEGDENSTQGLKFMENFLDTWNINFVFHFMIQNINRELLYLLRQS